MFSEPPKKMLILNILDILKKYTDENHRLSAKEIGAILQREYSQTADRKAVKRNLMNLLDFGYDIEYSEAERTNKKGETEIIRSDWYLNREFTDAELRLLVDGLLFSKHIPFSQCKKLIEKLEGLSNIHFKAKVKHIKRLPEKLTENKALFYTIDMLDEAIAAKKRVQFHYIGEYGTDKKPILRKNRTGAVSVYKVSPHQMAAANGRYYLICTHEFFENISNYRIDRITDIQLLDEPAEAPAHGFDLPTYMAENIYMFGGEGVQVTFRAQNWLIKDIIDWFGQDIRLRPDGGEHVLVTVRVQEQAMLYWSLQYGEHMEVLAPEGLRSRVGAAAKAICDKYGA